RLGLACGAFATLRQTRSGSTSWPKCSRQRLTSDASTSSPAATIRRHAQPGANARSSCSTTRSRTPPAGRGRPSVVSTSCSFRYAACLHGDADLSVVDRSVCGPASLGAAETGAAAVATATSAKAASKNGGRTPRCFILARAHSRVRLRVAPPITKSQRFCLLRPGCPPYVEGSATMLRMALPPQFDEPAGHGLRRLDRVIDRGQHHIFRVLWFRLPPGSVAWNVNFQALLASRFLSDIAIQLLLYGALIASARGGGSAFEAALIG